jgi:hypothetical protein
MLRNTFLHIPGVGNKTERKIWESGALRWSDFLESDGISGIGSSKRETISEYVKRSINCLNNGSLNFLLDNLPSGIHWRTYKELKEDDRCGFLDIETTGLDRDRHGITMIGIYDGSQSRIFIRGKNLAEFRDCIKNYDVLVTYNGKCFDVPFIQREFPDVDMKKFHIDLRYVMKKLGYIGGLKCVEKSLGVERSEEVRGMDGYEAVRLWKKFQRGHRKALKKLVDYNREDIENLEYLMDYAYRKLKDKHFVQRD